MQKYSHFSHTPEIPCLLQYHSVNFVNSIKGVHSTYKPIDANATKFTFFSMTSEKSDRPVMKVLNSVLYGRAQKTILAW